MKGLLLSGGMDSMALAWLERPEHCFFVDYGQLPANKEEEVSRVVAERVGSQYHSIKIDCGSIGAGCLIGKSEAKFSPSLEWWPFRNQLLVTIVGSKALEIGICNLLIGTVKSDNFHKDGTSEFIYALDSLMKIQEGNISVSAPAINMKSEELITISQIPEEFIYLSHSCHVSNIACGICPGCIKHFAILRILGIEY